MNNPDSFVHMSKGVIIGEKIAPNAREFFPGPGRYTMFVTYLSPVSRAFTTIAKAVVTEDGAFAAPAIGMVIT
jgi:hypothetical protein